MISTLDPYSLRCQSDLSVDIIESYRGCRESDFLVILGVRHGAVTV